MMSLAIIANRSRVPAGSRLSATHEPGAPSSTPSSALATLNPCPWGSLSAVGNRAERKFTSNASALPGKCRPAISLHGPPVATGMVRHPSLCALPASARQAARSSCDSLGRAILLLPENVVDLVLDFHA